MKTLVIISVLAAVVALVLGIIAYAISNPVLLSSAKWNELCQTLLLFAIGFGVWDYMNKK